MNSRYPIYPGWIVLAACFFCAMLVVGGTLYVFQLFVLPVSEEYKLSRADVNYGYIALLLGMALWSPFAGKILDKYPAKLIVPFGGFCFGLAFLIISRTHSLPLTLFTIAVLLGVAICLAGGLAANAITSRWFLRRRGRALGVASVASSAGGFVMVPLFAWLMENFGWRDALFYAGLGVSLLIALTGFIFIKGRPSEELKSNSTEFQLANSPRDGADTVSRVEEITWTVAKLIRNKNFWLINFGAGLLLASDQAILTSKYPLFIESGFSSVQAASIISAMTFSAIAGKFIVGYLADSVDVRHLFAVVAVFHVLLLLVFIQMPGYWPLLAFASLFGAAVGGIYPVWAALTAANFGAQNFGLVFGSMAPVMQTMAIIFVRFVAASFDKHGNYHFAFYCFIAAVITGMFLIYMTRKAYR